MFYNFTKFQYFAIKQLLLFLLRDTTTFCHLLLNWGQMLTINHSQKTFTYRLHTYICHNLIPTTFCHLLFNWIHIYVIIYDIYTLTGSSAVSSSSSSARNSASFLILLFFSFCKTVNVYSFTHTIHFSMEKK